VLAPLKTAALLLVAFFSFAHASASAQAQAPASAPQSDAKEQKDARKVASEVAVPNLPGILGFGKVTDTLYHGAQPTPAGFATLAKMGINVVVNFRGENVGKEREIVTRLGMEYVSIPWDCRHPTNQLVEQFFQALLDHPGKKIFIHCEYGVDRTGLMVAAYRMAGQGWTSAQALDEMKDHGFSFWHRRWCVGIESYEKKFPHQLEADPQLQVLRSPAVSPTH
jgi:protein tyrosine phosphatase (PTP) superfamily phosphohydrolase (DUF442 family)